MSRVVGAVCLAHVALAFASAAGAEIRPALILHSDEAWLFDVEGVSGDGSVVVGNYPRIARIAWTDGVPSLVPLTGESDPFIYDAADVSGDGSAVAGYQWSSSTDARAAAWLSGTIQLLPALGAVRESRAHGISADGSVVVGVEVAPTWTQRAVRWVDGVPSDLGDLPGGVVSARALAVSAEGSVVVGDSSAASHAEAFRWQDGVMVGLGSLPNHSVESTAWGVSADGAVVVGQSFSYWGYQAFRWEGGAMTALEDLPGRYVDSIAIEVSGDGSVVVGWGLGTETGDVEAFLWEVEHGLLYLADLLAYGYGLGFGDAAPMFVNGVSDDGQIVVGVACPDGDTTCNRGFVAAIPRSCADGLDNDGDALTDFPADPGCSSGADRFEIATSRACDDARDDDGDGLVDFPDDPGCASPLAAREDPACDDGADNDGDGGTDWDGGPAGGASDMQCAGRPFRGSEATRSCGLGAELALLAPALARLSSWRRVRRPRA
jgi:probable HAF family extracellular repeat protein